MSHKATGYTPEIAKTKTQTMDTPENRNDQNEANEWGILSVELPDNPVGYQDTTLTAEQSESYEYRDYVDSGETNEWYETSSEAIKNYTSHELGDEPRVERGVEPGCEVSVCIPTYEEGTDIIDTLETLSNQENINPEQFEVLINVNNSAESDESVRASNRQSMLVSRFLETGQEYISELSERDQQRLQEIQTHGLRVGTIDQSSKGREARPEADEKLAANPVMIPRKRTMDEAAERLASVNKPDGIVVSLDADTKVGPNFIHGLIERFDTNPFAAAVAGERRDGRNVDKSGQELYQQQIREQMLDEWEASEGVALTDKEREDIYNAKDLIDRYNALRKQSVVAEGVKSQEEQAFTGGSGKAIRADAYSDPERSRQFIELMDGNGHVPEGISEESFVIDKSEDLAAYPKARVREWAIDDDFEDLHQPTGSSGKEIMYAIESGLSGKESTVFNPQREEIGNLITELSDPENSQSAAEKLRQHGLSPELIERIGQVSDDQEMLRELVATDPELLKLAEQIPEKVGISEAIEKYERQLGVEE